MRDAMTYTCTACHRPCSVSGDLTSNCCGEILASASGQPLTHAEFDDLIMDQLEQMEE